MVVDPSLKLEMSCFPSPLLTILFFLPKHEVMVTLNMKQIVTRRNHCLSTSYDLVVTNIVHRCLICYGFWAFRVSSTVWVTSLSLTHKPTKGWLGFVIRPELENHDQLKKIVMRQNLHNCSPPPIFIEPDCVTIVDLTDKKTHVLNLYV